MIIVRLATMKQSKAFANYSISNENHFPNDSYENGVCFVWNSNNINHPMYRYIYIYILSEQQSVDVHWHGNSINKLSYTNTKNEVKNDRFSQLVNQTVNSSKRN